MDACTSPLGSDDVLVSLLDVDDMGDCSPSIQCAESA
jgi:hypothetical protein